MVRLGTPLGALLKVLASWKVGMREALSEVEKDRENELT